MICDLDGKPLSMEWPLPSKTAALVALLKALTGSGIDALIALARATPIRP